MSEEYWAAALGRPLPQRPVQVAARQHGTASTWVYTGRCNKENMPGGSHGQWARYGLDHMTLWALTGQNHNLKPG